MRRVLMTALAMTALASATPAFAQAQVNPDNTDQNTQIHASPDSHVVAPNVGQLVYGNTNTSSGHDVKFYGYTNYDGSMSLANNNLAYGTSITISGGTGYAQIDDTDYSPQGGATNNLYAVLMDPDPAFTSYGFGVALNTHGNDTQHLWIYYMLTGSSTWVNAINSPLLTGGSNGQFVLNGLNPGESFDRVLLLTDINGVSIQSVKQNSINLLAETRGGVPEPASWALMLLGFGGIGLTLRRRRKDVRLLQIA